MKTITSFKIAGLITACLFAAMPTKADIGAISFKTSAAGMNALETTIGSNQMTLETWLYIGNSTGFFASNMHNDKGFALGFDGWFKFQLDGALYMDRSYFLERELDSHRLCRRRKSDDCLR